MSAKFTFEVDPAHDLVRIVMRGLFMPVHVSDFFEARKIAHRRLRCAPGTHVTLTDLRGLEMVPHDTADAFAALLTDPLSRARRLAFLVTPTLVRSQLIRVLAGRTGRLFTDAAEAEAWLLEAPAEIAEPAQRRAAGGM